jgi:hypothetical protein
MSSPKKDFVGAVTLLLEQEMLVVSVDGYMWGLDPTTGDERWHNPLKGMGTGIPMMVSNSQLTGGTTAAAAATAAAVAAAGAASVAWRVAWCASWSIVDGMAISGARYDQAAWGVWYPV